MRLGLVALSAVLLSGCSWLGGFGGSGYHGGDAYNGRYGASAGAHGAKALRNMRSAGPCQIFTPTQPVPHGCNPAEVTLATPGAYGGFPQQPDFSGGQYISGGYGSHAAQARQQAAHYQPQKKLRKPRWRGSMSLGIEKSVGGDYLNYGEATGAASQLVPATASTLDGTPFAYNTFAFNGFVPALSYDPFDYREGRTIGSQDAGQIVQERYYADIEDLAMPNISFDDVHSTPVTLSGGLEFIASDRTTLFANAGYSYAEGENGNTIGISGTLLEEIRTRTYQPTPIPAATTTTDPDGNVVVIPGVDPGTFDLISDVSNFGFVPNVNIANYAFNFSDMERINLEAGARHYFNPIMKGQTKSTITPFIGASAGANRYNAQSFTVSQTDQLFYERAYESRGADLEYYDPQTGTQVVDIYDSQWVPAGQINAGIEWQMTPKTALAFETGIKVEGGRKYSNGVRGDENVSIPVTIRGSYNF